MANDSSVKLGIGLIVGGITIVGIALARYRKKRKFEDIARIDIASAPQGLVELNGFAWAKAQYQNLEGRASAYISWRLEKRVRSGKNSKWVTVSNGAIPDGFVLQDQSGAAWVNMDNVDFDSQGKSISWNQLAAENKSRFLSWLPTAKMRDPHFPPRESIFGSSYRIKISELQVGCPVVAQGNFFTSRKEILGLLAGFNSFKEKFLKLKTNTAYTMNMLDADKDGVLDEEEHRMGHVYLASSVMRSVVNGPDMPQPQQDSVEISGHLIGSESHKLIVANTNEAFLLSRLARGNVFLCILGALMVAGGVCILFRGYV